LSFFSKIFSGTKGADRNAAPFVNPIQVEFHSHLIFGVDDGCETIEQSLEILEGFAKLGMRKVITTPHIMSDFYKNSKENLFPIRDEIRRRLKENNIELEFECAAEYLIDDGFEKKIEKGDLLTFGPNGKHVLVELPFMNEPRNLAACLFELQIAGFIPVLAHPERYLYYNDERTRFHDLKDQGILFQMNMLSCLGYYSKPVQDAAIYLVNNNLVDLVGSDTHNIKHQELLSEVHQNKVYQKVCEGTLLNNYL
jgi:tyrosine-protein phosphatase YwqE